MPDIPPPPPTPIPSPYPANAAYLQVKSPSTGASIAISTSPLLARLVSNVLGTDMYSTSIVSCTDLNNTRFAAQVQITTVDGTDASLDISTLPAGAYIIEAKRDPLQDGDEIARVRVTLTGVTPPPNPKT